MTSEKLNSIDEFLEKVPIASSTARAWIHQGRLPVIRLGRRVFIKQSVINKMIDEGFPKAS